MQDEIVEKLKNIIKPYIDEDEVDINTLKADSHLINDIGLDSFYVIDIVIDIENEFDIAIENEEITQFETVQQVVEIILEKVNAK